MPGLSLCDKDSDPFPTSRIWFCVRCFWVYLPMVWHHRTKLHTCVWMEAVGAHFLLLTIIRLSSDLWNDITIIYTFIHSPDQYFGVTRVLSWHFYIVGYFLW